MSDTAKRKALAKLCFRLNGHGSGYYDSVVQELAEYLGIEYTEEMRALDESADTFRGNLNRTRWVHSSVCWFEEDMIKLLDPEWSTSWDTSY